uniref:Uncharacterized protein n=1 Tax=Arundo donax TaxID=35708 RepID=A0A0A9ESG2_ARUDO
MDIKSPERVRENEYYDRCMRPQDIDPASLNSLDKEEIEKEDEWEDESDKKDAAAAESSSKGHGKRRKNDADESETHKDVKKKKTNEPDVEKEQRVTADNLDGKGLSDDPFDDITGGAQTLYDQIQDGNDIAPDQVQSLCKKILDYNKERKKGRDT